MNIQEHVNLSTFNSFAVGSTARYFYSISSVHDITELLDSSHLKNENYYILGEGSNTLFAKDYSGLVLKVDIKGLEVVNEDQNTVRVRVGAGENWDDFVSWSLDQSFWGIENLSLIPGSVGASAVQNIGAYGVEVKDTLCSVFAYDLKNKKKVLLNKDQCKLSYRSSIFKEFPNQYIITHVEFVLLKESSPILVYKELMDKVLSEKILNPSSKDISSIVIKIRDSKLPRIEVLASAGSFFKNPVISLKEADKLLSKYPHMKCYDYNGKRKVSAAWLIDSLGYKGYRKGNVGCYDDHALVIVNHGGAVGKDILSFSQEISLAVYKKYRITLEPEIVIVQ